MNYFCAGGGPAGHEPPVPVTSPRAVSPCTVSPRNVNRREVGVSMASVYRRQTRDVSPCDVEVRCHVAGCSLAKVD